MEIDRDTRLFLKKLGHVSPSSPQVPIVGKMLDSGCVTLDGIEFHGPKAEWPKFKEAADALGAKYYDVDASFSRFRRGGPRPARRGCFAGEEATGSRPPPRALAVSERELRSVPPPQAPQEARPVLLLSAARRRPTAPREPADVRSRSPSPRTLKRDVRGPSSGRPDSRRVDDLRGAAVPGRREHEERSRACGDFEMVQDCVNYGAVFMGEGLGICAPLALGDAEGRRCKTVAVLAVDKLVTSQLGASFLACVRWSQWRPA